MWETYDDVELCVDVYQLSLVVDDWQGGDALRNELVQGLDDRGLLAGGLKSNTNSNSLNSNSRKQIAFDLGIAFFPPRLTSMLSNVPMPRSPMERLR